MRFTGLETDHVLSLATILTTQSNRQRTFTILFVLHDDVIIFEKMAAEVHLLSSAFHQTRYLIGGRFVLNRW